MKCYNPKPKTAEEPTTQSEIIKKFLAGGRSAKPNVPITAADALQRAQATIARRGNLLMSSTDGS